MENEIGQFTTDSDVFRKLWTSPRQVFRHITDNHFDKYTTLLLVLSGISRGFSRAVLNDMGDHSSLMTIIAMSIFAGGLFGWMSYYIYGALIGWTGKWLDGEGDTKSIVRMLSFALLPSIIALVFFIPQIAILGIEVFKSDGEIAGAGPLSNFFLYGSIFLEFILGIWAIVLCVIGISEVQKLSIGKSILNLLLPMLIIVIPIILMVVMFAK